MKIRQGFGNVGLLAAMALAVMGATGSAWATLVEPLVNPGFESGFSGWTPAFTEMNVVTGNETVGPATLGPTEGGHWLKRSWQDHSENSSRINVGLMYFRQAVDVSSFTSISSVTYGGDYFAAAQITAGSGFVELSRPTVADFYVRFLDGNGSLLASTHEFGAPTPPADITSGLFVNDLRRTVTTIPTGTAQIEFRAGMSFDMGSTVPGQPLTVNVTGGMDDMYLAVEGTTVPEPGTMGLLSTVAAAILRRRRKW